MKSSKIGFGGFAWKVWSKKPKDIAKILVTTAYFRNYRDVSGGGGNGLHTPVRGRMFFGSAGVTR